MSNRREYLGVVATGLAGALTGCLDSGSDSPTATDDAGTATDGTGSNSPMGAEAAGSDATATETDGESGTDADGPLDGSITVTGSSTVYPVVAAVAQAFQNEDPEVDIAVSPTGTGGGFSNHFCVGNADFNAASRPISGEERQRCSGDDIEYHEMRIATDALTVVVNTDNDWVDCVTPDQLREIWRADGARTWADVDSEWPDEAIQRYGPADTSGTFDYFTETVIREDAAHTGDYVGTEQDTRIIQGVQQDRNAIGYLGLAYYQNNQERVNTLAIDDGNGCVEPSLETARNGDYQPLTRPLYTYVNTDRLGEAHVAEFARFFVEQSANEDLVADEVGYVPNTDEEMETELAALNDAIADAQ